VAGLPEGAPKTTLRRACGSTCHALEVVVGTRRDQASWAAMIDTMVSRGAAVKADERQVILDYLLKHLGQ
jgi:hypothetical protein